MGYFRGGSFPIPSIPFHKKKSESYNTAFVFSMQTVSEKLTVCSNNRIPVSGADSI